MDCFSQTVELTSGLGDCIVAGAAIQALGRNNNLSVNFKTNPILDFLFNGNPNIKTTDKEGNIRLKWVSQYKDKNLYPLHTMQRFSYQLGFFIDPTDVLDVYINKKKIINNPSNKTILINPLSAEYNRRYIPSNIIDNIEKLCIEKGYEVVYIGDSYKESTKDIKTCTALLENCKLFIGPVSFYYHLASALRVKSILFTNYMPEHKFSHFFNTISINPTLGCVNLCEEREKEYRTENNCWNKCKAIDYNLAEIKEKLLSCL